MTNLATDNLAELIRKKHLILVQLRDIGRRQQVLVDQSATTVLLQLLGAKQHLIAALQMVERSLRPYQAEDPESRVWRSPTDREVSATKAAECQQLLSEVMELERDQEARMVERRDEVAQQLRRVNTAHQAADAYQQHRGPQHRTVVSDIPDADVRLDLLAGGR
jgi:flagellar biosynthesis/type III secretory pathway chaperone